jgi:hypothetical protein
MTVQMSQKKWEAIIKSREEKLLADFIIEIEKRDKLITELCDALELPFEEWTDQSDLVQRAREATKCQP